MRWALAKWRPTIWVRKGAVVADPKVAVAVQVVPNMAGHPICHRLHRPNRQAQEAGRANLMAPMSRPPPRDRTPMEAAGAQQRLVILAAPVTLNPAQAVASAVLLALAARPPPADRPQYRRQTTRVKRHACLRNKNSALPDAGNAGIASGTVRS